VLCWLLFPSPDLWYYRWLAALVPLLFTIQFALIGFGIVKDEASVKAMSRTGDRREILHGPLFYGNHLRCHDGAFLERFAHRYDCRHV